MKIKIDDSYYITSDSYNPAILVKFGINKENGKVVELRRWYCGRKLSAAFDEYIKQTANADDEIKTMQGYAAIGDKVFSIALTGAVVFGGAYLILKEQE